MADFTPITEAAFRKGRERTAALRPRTVSASFDRASHRVLVRLDTGLDLSFDPRTAFGLEKATAAELSDVEVVGAGGSIHFPQLDVFFSVPRILEGYLGPLNWSRREARVAASRANGKLGGRPRKVSEPA